MKLTLLIFTAYLIFGSLMPNSDFRQLRQFTELRSHYMDHISEAQLLDQSLSFVQFLQLHFINPRQHQDADHEEDHHKLPLQTFDFSVNFLLFFSPSATPYSILGNDRPQRLETRHRLLKGFPSAVFQPPSLS